jgi:ankyrin repeat protein
VSGLESLFDFTSELACSAGWLLFRFASEPQFPAVNKDVDECCGILIRLCHLGSALGQSILESYHKLHGKRPEELQPEWLEIAASSGSHYATESLCECFPELYLQLMQNPLGFEPSSAESGEIEALLLQCCREGDYEQCKLMLLTGAPAHPSQGMTVSPLHWLVSFREEAHINDILHLLLQNGADLDACEGEQDDFTFGRVVGTPLHWAIWHRNVPVVRALTKADNMPKLRHVDRAICIAAAMHFYDVLEVLKNWIFGLKNAVPHWHEALILAVDHNGYLLPRRLRHGNNNLSRALERTMDILLEVYTPSADDIRNMFILSVIKNNPTLLRYMFKRLDLDKRRDLLVNVADTYALWSMAQGFIQILDIYVERGLVSPQSEHSRQKWKPLQLCLIARQRDPAFTRRLLEIGCPVDDVGSSEETDWTPFSIALTFGLYNIAVILLENGADKDRCRGWLGGSTVTISLLQA